MNESQEMLRKSKQRQFRAAGIVLFWVSISLLVARIVTSLFTRALAGKVGAVTQEVLSDVFFTLLVQVVSLGIVPFFIYKLYLKVKASDVFYMSNYARVDWKICLCCFVIGIFGLFVTIFVSSIWQSLVIVIFGYTPSSSVVMPEKFNFFHLLLTLVLTAVCPAIFEEFVNRGIALNVLRNSFGRFTTLLLAGLMFGLFHGHILQVFYTMLMGILLAYLTLRLKSIWPAMIVHFTNNALSVAFDFLGEYSAFDPLGMISSLMGSNYSLYFLLVLASIGVIVFMLALINKIYAKKYSNSFTQITVDGKFNTALFQSMLHPNVSSGYARYKPTASDYAFYISALFTSIMTTVLTLVFGVF